MSTLPTRCPVCAHSQVQAINRELDAGARPGDLAAQYGLSALALRRHQRVCLGRLAAPTANGDAHERPTPV